MSGGAMGLVGHPEFRRRLAAPVLVAAALLLAGGLALAAAVLHASAERDRLAAVGEQLAAAQSLQARLVPAGALEPRALVRYRELAGGGLFSAERRAWWTEWAAERVRGYEPLAFNVELGPPRAEAMPEDAQRWFDETGAAPAQLLSHDLQLTVEGLHEGEVAALVAELTDARRGAVRLEECTLARRADGIGLDTRCVLRFLSVAWPEA